jgi:hypothetical protein
MGKGGVVLDPDGAVADDYARLVTWDPQIAQKYGMQDASELWPDPTRDEPS